MAWRVTWVASYCVWTNLQPQSPDQSHQANNCFPQMDICHLGIHISWWYVAPESISRTVHSSHGDSVPCFHGIGLVIQMEQMLLGSQSRVPPSWIWLEHKNNDNFLSPEEGCKASKPLFQSIFFGFCDCFGIGDHNWHYGECEACSSSHKFVS